VNEIPQLASAGWGCGTGGGDRGRRQGQGRADPPGVSFRPYARRSVDLYFFFFFHYHFEDVNREVINAGSFVSRSIVSRLFLPERW